MAYIGNSPANVGNYQIVDDISGSFNGSTTSFALATAGTTITPAKSGQLLVGVNGVMQEPDDTSTNGFKVSGSNIVFSSAPASGDTFWAVYQGQSVDIGTPSDDVVDTIHIKDNAITADKIAAGAVVADVADDSITNAMMADNAIDSDQITSGAVDDAHIADVAATKLTGTIADARFPATLPTASATNLTSIPAGNLTGTVADARISTLTASKLTGALPAISGASLTSLPSQTANDFTNTLKTKLDGIATSANLYVHPNHSGEVTSTADGATVIADNIVDEANLKISNSPSNGYFLSAQSGNTGGLTWAEVDALPSQSGNSGKFLTTDATNASWATVDALPTQLGNAGKYLTTNATTASWATLDTDSNSTTKGLYEMANTISANYTISNNNNAISAGPITINSLISVTIPSGSTWVIA